MSDSRPDTPPEPRSGRPRERPKRSQVAFVLAVFGTIAVGALVERSRRPDPAELFPRLAPPRPRLNEVVPPRGSHALSGVVLEASGEPAANVQVFLYPKDEEAEGGPDGGGRDRDDPENEVGSELSPRNPATTAPAEPSDGPTRGGWGFGMEGDGGASAELSAAAEPDGAAASENAANAPPPAAHPLHWDFTDARGRFALEGLHAGRYLAALVRQGHGNPTREVSVPADSHVVWRLPEPLEPLPTLPEIQRAPLEGRILPPLGRTPDEHPLAGYEVVLRPADNDPVLSGAVTRRAVTDDQGAFRVEELVAADYRVQVLPPWASGGSWPVLEEVYHRHEPDPPPGTHLALRLRSGELAGRLVDLDERPLEGGLIVVRSADGGEERLWPPAISDDQGAFRVPDLPAGAYTVRIRAGDAVRELEVELGAAERAKLEVEPLDPRREDP